MESRRQFLKKSAVMTTAGLGAISYGSVSSAEPSPSATEVPDTLDMADRGQRALNGVLGSVDPDIGFEPYFLTFLDVHPAYMIHWSSMVSGVLPKYLEAVPMLRLMSGSDEGRDTEKGILDSVIANVSEDGLIYDRAAPNRPWNTGVGYGVKGWDEDYANLAGNGRLLAGFLFYYQFTGDESWRKLAQRTAQRMRELAIVKGDYAYYPNVGLGNDFSYPRKSGWVHQNEPQSEKEGSEHALLFYELQPVRGFARWYALSGDERFLALSRQLVAFCLQRKWWGGLNDTEPQAGAERGHYWGHYHGHTAALRGMLDYAIVADNWRVKEFVRDSYEWSRHHGIPRLGIFPGTDGWTEGCAVADMVGLAAALSDAGVGDYWDDVDQYARNGLLEVQASDRQEMERVAQAGRARSKDSPWGGYDDPRFHGFGGVLPGQETTDRVIDRSVGAFGFLKGARHLEPRLMHCCTANGSQALYSAWEGITRKQGDAAEVNLWLNRRAPWAEVWSWLPHEGRLQVNNKGMRRIAIRVPGWTSPAKLRCLLNDKEVRPTRVGNRLVFDALRGNEQFVLEVPLAVEKTVLTLANLNGRSTGLDEYNCEFVGNTVISVGNEKPSPSGQDLEWYRAFRREGLRARITPTKAKPSYEPPNLVINWDLRAM
jgi:hypothetical protein